MSGECDKCAEHCLDCKCVAEDKRSIEYFMTKMTKAEFQEMLNDVYVTGYHFNMINREKK